jgi:hypothetical protein
MSTPTSANECEPSPSWPQTELSALRCPIWPSEVDGLKVSLDAAQKKLAQVRRTRAGTTDLPTPTIGPRRPR